MLRKRDFRFNGLSGLHQRDSSIVPNLKIVGVLEAEVTEPPDSRFDLPRIQQRQSKVVLRPHKPGFEPDGFLKTTNGICMPPGLLVSLAQLVVDRRKPRIQFQSRLVLGNRLIQTPLRRQHISEKVVSLDQVRVKLQGLPKFCLRFAQFSRPEESHAEAVSYFGRVRGQLQSFTQFVERLFPFSFSPMPKSLVEVLFNQGTFRK